MNSFEMENKNNLENILQYTDHHIRIKYSDDSVDFYNDSNNVVVFLLEVEWSIFNMNDELQVVCRQLFSTLLTGGGTIVYDHQTLDDLFNPKYAPTDGTDFPESFQIEVPETAVQLKYNYTRLHSDNGMHFCVYAYVHFLKK